MTAPRPYSDPTFRRAERDLRYVLQGLRPGYGTTVTDARPRGQWFAGENYRSNLHLFDKACAAWPKGQPPIYGAKAKCGSITSKPRMFVQLPNIPFCHACLFADRRDNPCAGIGTTGLRFRTDRFDARAKELYGDGVSMTYIAERLGIDKSTLSLYRTHHRRPSHPFIEAVGEAFGGTFDDFFTYDEAPR